jgi:hypothetical protein
MQEFDELLIPRSTVEELSQQEINNLLIGGSWRRNWWKKPQQVIQIGLIQLVGAAMIFAIAMLPIDRAFQISSSSLSPPTKVSRLIWIDGAITLAILGGINWWMIDRGRRSRQLMKLVEQVEEFNRIVQAITTIARITSLTTPNTGQENEIVLDVLKKTRHNLLTALQIERHLQQQPLTPASNISIAHNLLHLQHLAEQSQIDDYQTLLTQAWEIGRSVYADRADLTLTPSPSPKIGRGE